MPRRGSVWMLVAVSMVAAGCATTLRGRRTERVATEPTLHEGIPFRLSIPVFVMQGLPAAGGKVEYSVAVQYIADPNGYYLVNIDPALLHSNAFGLNYGTYGNLKKVSSSGTQMIGPTIAAIGSFAVSAITAASAFQAYHTFTGVPKVPGMSLTNAPHPGPDLARRIETAAMGCEMGPLERKAAATLASRLREGEGLAYPKSEAERSVLMDMRRLLEKAIVEERLKGPADAGVTDIVERVEAAFQRPTAEVQEKLGRLQEEAATDDARRNVEKMAGIEFELNHVARLLAGAPSPPLPAPQTSASLYDRVKFHLQRLAELAKADYEAGLAEPSQAYLDAESALHALLGTKPQLDLRRTSWSVHQGAQDALSKNPTVEEWKRLNTIIKETQVQVDELKTRLDAAVAAVVVQGPPGPRRVDKDWKLQEVRPPWLRWPYTGCAPSRSDAAWVKKEIQVVHDCCQTPPRDFPEFVIVLERGDQR